MATYSTTTRNWLISGAVLLTLGLSGGIIHHEKQVNSYTHFQTHTTELAQQALPPENETTHSIIMVYKDGCPYCKAARETITKALNKHPNDAIQFTQVHNTSPLGEKLLADYNAVGSPLIIITNGKSNTTHYFNDSEALGINHLLDKYIFDK